MPLEQLGWNTVTIVLAIFAFALLVQLVWYLLFFLRIAAWKAPKAERQPPVSVVICAKNEAKNLKAHLPEILRQEYPEYQVVVVNDGSWDATQEVLQEFQKKHAHLHIVNVPENDRSRYNKKVAVMMGVKGCKYEHIIFTDADCRPNGKEWLKYMANGFSDKKNLVLGYGAYARTKGLLNKIIRFDTFHIGMQYLSFAKAGIPYMGVGRNMGYTSELFYKVGGFRKHYSVLSGDDDLFVNEAGRRKNTVIEIRPEAHTISNPKTTWRDWWRQKQRHMSTAVHYRYLFKILLTLYPLSYLLLLSTFLVLVIWTDWKWVVGGAFLFRMLLQIIIFNRAMRFLGEKDLLILVPFMEVFFLVFNPLVYGASLIAKPKQSRWS